MGFLSPLEPAAYFLLRFFAGFMMSFHGMQKLFGWFSTYPMPAQFSQAWFGGVIELVFGIAVAIGLLTRLSAFIVSGMMAVAFFQFHLKGDFTGWHWLPIVNQGETAVLYCFAFLLIATRGPGPVALDNFIRR